MRIGHPIFPTLPTTMTNEKLRNLITVAVSLDRQVAALSEQLKDYKARIVKEAATRQEEATPTDGGGSSITFEGADGCVARVAFHGDTLKSSIKPGDKQLPKIKELAGRFFHALLDTEIHYKPGQDFREKAVSALGAKDGGRLVKLCQSRGKTTVSFETKEVA